MNAQGFLGTNASVLADISLIMGLLVAVTLTIGVVLAVRRRYEAHCRVQTIAVALNVVQVLAIMIASFLASVAPGIPQRLDEPFYLSATLHAGLGLVTLLFGTFVALRGNELVPRPLKFNNYKLFMRTAYSLYMLATLLGVWVYLTWYTGAPQVTAGATAQPVAQRPNELIVPMANFEFNPKEVVIPVGTTVVWVNQDGAPHTATADDGTAFTSDLLSTGQRFSHTFDQPGEFAYFCELHGSAGGVGMAGKLKVVPPEQAPPLVAAAPARATPTPGPTPHPLPPQPFGRPAGTAAFRDANARGDQLALELQLDATPPANTSPMAFLMMDDAVVQPLGELGLDGGTARLTFTAPDRTSLAGRFDRLVITFEPRGSAPGQPTSQPVFEGVLPEQAFGYLNRLLANGVGRQGYVVGLRTQTDVLLHHAQLVAAAQSAGDVSGVRRHAEHVFNLIVGAHDAQFGDHNGDGRAQNPGDGFGLLPNGDRAGYLKATLDAALGAERAADATEAIKVHARHVAISVENMQGWTEEARGLALRLTQATDADVAKESAARLVTLAHWLSRGNDADGDGAIAPVFGEGGGLVAYEHAQFMAGFGLFPTKPLGT